MQHRIDDERKLVPLDADQRANSALAKRGNGQQGLPLFPFDPGITKEGIVEGEPLRSEGS